MYVCNLYDVSRVMDLPAGVDQLVHSEWKCLSTFSFMYYLLMPLTSFASFFFFFFFFFFFCKV